MKRTTILMAAFLCLFSLTESPAQNTHKNMEQLNLTQEWDKTYPKSDKVNHSLSLIHISEPTRRTPISYAVFCLKKKKIKARNTTAFALHDGQHAAAA